MFREKLRRMTASGEICARHFQTKQPVRVFFENGVVTRMEPVAGLREEVWIAPALFDLQVNGYGGVDFQRDGCRLLPSLRADWFG